MTYRVDAPVDLAIALADFVAVEPSITQWHRIEADPAAPDLAPGLEARIADPLWLVGRQWQLGELRGEDAGSPVRVDLEGESAPIAFPPGNARAAHSLLGGNGLIEPLIEAEPLAAARPALAIEAGADFVRALALQGVANVAGAFMEAFPFVAPSGFDARRDPAGARFIALAAGRAIDGRALAEALGPLLGANGAVASLPASIDVPAANRTATLAAANDWFTLWSTLAFHPVGEPAWNDARLEYAFSLEARHSSGTTPLVAHEYHGGRLDWWSFDVGVPGTPATPFAGETVKIATLPTPIRYPGMPADRYWEFENGSVNLAQPKGGPTAIALMLVLEYELVASNDWFHVPLELRYGTSFSVTTLAVTDTFGHVTPVPRAPGGASGWGMFELTPATPSSSAAPLFILPQVTAEVLDSPPLEELSMFRDEMANLVWGVEKRLAGFTGASIDPLQGEQRAVPLSQQPEQFDDLDAASLYRLQSTVPFNWFPFVAQQDPTGPAGSIVLARRNLRRLVRHGDAIAEQVSKPEGALLNGSEQRFKIEEREVPRSGLALTRTIQHARTAQGERIVWLGRHKRVGRGEGESDLRYDYLDSVKGKR